MRYSYLFFFILFIGNIYSDQVRDPFEDFNRKTFNFNERIDEKVLKPIAKTYSKLPPNVKNGVSNFFNNLEDVETSINPFLQGKPKKAINVNLPIKLKPLFQFKRYIEYRAQPIAAPNIQKSPVVKLKFIR